MKKFLLLSIPSVLILLTLTMSYNLWAAEQMPGGETYKPHKPDQKCVLTLDFVDKTAGLPGTVFQMYGTFGAVQGAKMPAINGPGSTGTEHALIVNSWSNKKLVVQVPANLTPGSYKVGVYCNDPCKPGAITTYGMVWRDFQVLKMIHGPLSGTDKSKK